MPFFATSEAPPRPESMKFPVFCLLAGNLAISETSSQLTPPSSGESANYRFPEHEDGFLIDSTFELGIAVEIFGLPGMGPDWYRVIGCARSSTDPLRTTLRRREPLSTSRRPRRCP
jgi:hypothetical protein